jgi:hypothetical protein
MSMILGQRLGTVETPVMRVCQLSKAETPEDYMVTFIIQYRRDLPVPEQGRKDLLNVRSADIHREMKALRSAEL